MVCAVLVLAKTMVRMAEFNDQESQMLLAQAAAGDQTAADRLLELHRDRLRAMIALRLDRRLSARVDPSDVLQETMIQAHQKLPEYLRTQPIPFYPWLRQMAWENIVQLHRQHLWPKRGPSRGKNASTWRCPTNRRWNWPSG